MQNKTPSQGIIPNSLKKYKNLNYTENYILDQDISITEFK